VTSREQLAEFVAVFASNALDDPRLWSASAGEFVGSLEQALLTMPGYPAEDRSGIDPEAADWRLFAWVLQCARVYLDM
jgi:hypothetical protein